MLSKPRALHFYLLLFIGAGSLSAAAQSTGKLTNSQYEVELKKDASVLITHKQSGKSYRLTPRFTIMKRLDDPVIKFTSRSAKFTPKANNFLRIPYWRKEGSKDETADFFESAQPVNLNASSGKVDGNKVEWNFTQNDAYTLTATLSLDKNVNEPVIEYHFVPKQEAYYSIGYTGMPQLDPAKTDAIWQPFVWQEKRFPEKPFLSTEDMCGIPGTMVEKDKMTYGVIADPRAIPYRLPDQTTGNIKFGVLVRNQQGNAQPQIFAPVFGNGDSKLKAGQDYSFQFRVFIYQGHQPDAYIYAAKNIFGFRDYRKNVYTNLNQTIENMIDFEMDDVYSHWSADMKGFDYSTDVANTEKNVSALHPLSTAIITDNEGIYLRRALPMTEYLISREKYLFSVDKTVKSQQPSSRMKGPAVEVSELAALNDFYQGKSPVFGYFADSLSHTTRKLNLTKDSKGDDWPNLLSLYKMTGKADYLTRAEQKADEYIKRRVNTLQTDFSDASTEQSAMFWSDYSPLWIELLNMYETTKQQRYLDAAVDGAKQYMQYTWFCPVIPKGNITLNPHDSVPYLSPAAIREKTTTKMLAAKQEVPAWRVSQIGLTPESSYTFYNAPAIFLANQAPHLLRLAYYTHNDFFRSVARSAIVGRYSNYPGYTILKGFSTIYSRPDYPLRNQKEVSYNQLYYNHVWPQISILFDYLISDVYARSKANINFPAEFAVGYAYLKSNVYGQHSGTFYGDTNVSLWMPKQVIRLDNEQVNYLTSYGNNKFYITLLNESDKEQEVEVNINPNLVPVNMNGAHTARLWKDNGPASAANIVNGKIKVKLSPKGIAAIAVNGIHVVTQFQQKIVTGAEKPSQNSYRMADSPFGKIRSAIFDFGQLSNTYIWLEASNDDIKEATFNYRASGQKDWIKQTDSSYPFELSVPMQHGETEMEYWIEAKSVDGKSYKSATIKLQK